VICFENATGFADILKRNAATRQGIIPRLNYRAAASFFALLAGHKPLLEEMSRATKSIAEETFSMERYVEGIDAIGRDAGKIMMQRAQDLRTIETDPAFDPVTYSGFEIVSNSRSDAIINYITRSSAYVTSREPTAALYNRRPCSGFHPHNYAFEHSRQFDPRLVNPLAHFLRNGRPKGPWSASVIDPSSLDLSAINGSHVRIALHGHFHYPELIVDMVRKLGSNRSYCDLLLTATDKRKVQILRQATKEYDRGDVIVRLVPNRGRDIGAFLTGFGDIVGRYDVIGHVHGKRSLFLGDTVIGERWREFLWQHLIGDLYPMIDVVVHRFATAPTCGLIFAEDPHLPDWDMNRGIADRLAQRMGINKPLPPFFDFPVGTMFWARPVALQPLFDLKLDWEEYPREPLVIDGTILHAIERMLPFVAEHAGFSYAMTHLPGITW
jgi:hypothetical protein